MYVFISSTRKVCFPSTMRLLKSNAESSFIDSVRLINAMTWKQQHADVKSARSCTVWVCGVPVLPVFFMVVWLDDSALNFSSISSWYSSETTACSSVMSTGDWFFAAHSGYEAAQPLGPWLPAGTENSEALMKNLDLSPRKHVCPRDVTTACCI